MNPAEYRRMHEAEGRMWWYRGLHANLLAALARTGAVEGAVLDAGCGTGGLLARLAAAFPAAQLIGLDREPLAAALAAEKSGVAVCVGSVEALPIADAALAAIVSADVLSHRGVDEALALAELYRALKPGGVLVLNLPAYQWLLSAHDRAVHNERRYTVRRVERLLAAAGFGRVRACYWNSIPFPLMVIRRKLLASREAPSDVGLLPAPVEAAFRAVMRFETFLIGWGMALPFGGSVLATAVR